MYFVITVCVYLFHPYLFARIRVNEGRTSTIIFETPPLNAVWASLTHVMTAESHIPVSKVNRLLFIPALLNDFGHIFCFTHTHIIITVYEHHNNITSRIHDCRILTDYY